MGTGKQEVALMEGTQESRVICEDLADTRETEVLMDLTHLVV